MSEILEELKAVVDNAPDGATHYDSLATWKYKNLDRGTFLMPDGTGYKIDEFYPNETIRSLADIKRIIELMEDKLRLDHLQKCNEIFNKRAGSNYGWRVDWNHNRIAVVDTGVSGVSIRRAIDEHIKKVGDL